MRRINVIGAGFPGLTLAFELHRLGFKVKIHERTKRPGGLLGTSHSTFGLAETAASALLCNHEIEELFDELKVPFAERLPERKRRYIDFPATVRFRVNHGPFLTNRSKGRQLSEV